MNIEKYLVRGSAAKLLQDSGRQNQVCRAEYCLCRAVLQELPSSPMPERKSADEQVQINQQNSSLKRPRPPQVNFSRPAKQPRAKGSNARQRYSARDKVNILKYRYGGPNTPQEQYPHTAAQTKDAFGVNKKMLGEWKKRCVVLPHVVFVFDMFFQLGAFGSSASSYESSGRSQLSAAARS